MGLTKTALPLGFLFVQVMSECEEAAKTNAPAVCGTAGGTAPPHRWLSGFPESSCRTRLAEASMDRINMPAIQ
jgi:hypothetical protein